MNKNEFPKIDFPIEKVLKIVENQVEKFELPSIEQLKKVKKEPFFVLVGTILSARTKDETTSKVTKRLFTLVDSPAELGDLDEKTLEKLIYPVGFYRNKAKALKKMCKMLLNNFSGTIPDTIEDLLRLPGVGRKTANLVLAQGFNIPAICVDTHVHRILNRWGYLKTKNPTETEKFLRKTLDSSWWISINTILVTFGKNICKPVSPICSQCNVASYCSRINVIRSR